MKQIQPDLWETEAENPAPGLTTHAYLLIRDGGNVLFYNTGHRHEIDQMAELGGHVREQTEFACVCAPDILFDKRETHLGNIEVIPTPGHTPRSTCFLVDSPHGKRYLFTGDTLFLGKDGAWQAGIISGYSERDALAESLELLQELEPDVVLSSAFGVGKAFFVGPVRRGFQAPAEGEGGHS